MEDNLNLFWKEIRTWKTTSIFQNWEMKKIIKLNTIDPKKN